MKASDRREAMRRIGAFALLVAAAPAFTPSARANRFHTTAPDGNHRLTRKIERSLADGRLLTVSRSWSCRFSPMRDGMRVESFEQSCVVEAPAGLEALAEMEMRRKEDGPFPALLDSQGQIEGGRSTAVGASADAVEAALGLLIADRSSVEEVTEARQFMDRLRGAAGAAMSAIPNDLFFPLADARKFNRTLALPDGSHGEVSVEFVAAPAPATGLLDRIERHVATRIGTDTRHSRELWSLARI